MISYGVAVLQPSLIDLGRYLKAPNVSSAANTLVFSQQELFVFRIRLAEIYAPKAGAADTGENEMKIVAGGYIITLTKGGRPKNYLVVEADQKKALEALGSKLGSRLKLAIEPLPISASFVADHGLGPGAIKELHL